MKLVKITQENEETFLESVKDGLGVIFFDAEFTDQKHVVETAIQHIQKVCPRDRFDLATCDAEECHELATKLSVISLPCVVFVRKGTVTMRLIDLEPSIVERTLQLELKFVNGLDYTIDPNDMKLERLKFLINSAPVMVFMKGNPEQPRCGFSKQLIELLAKNNIKYDSFNILEDEEVRQGLKEYSDWPTYPQIYSKGDFIGGLDILKQLEEAGELKSALNVE